MPAVKLQDKTSDLARQLARDSFQSQGRVARMPYSMKNDLSHSSYTLL